MVHHRLLERNDRVVVLSNTYFDIWFLLSEYVRKGGIFMLYTMREGHNCIQFFPSETTMSTSTANSANASYISLNPPVISLRMELSVFRSSPWICAINASKETAQRRKSTARCI